MTDERWAPFPLSSHYEISDLGRVRWAVTRYGRAKGTEVRPWVNAYGYQMVTIRDDSGKRVKRAVHRYVALAFLGKPPFGKNHAAHYDGNPRNNRLSNLRWASAKENAADRIRHGRQKRGERHHIARLTNSDALQIRQRYAAGEINTNVLAEDFCISTTLVRLVLRGKAYQDAGGPVLLGRMLRYDSKRRADRIKATGQVVLREVA